MSSSFPTKPQTGFSLIEVLVGVAIGLIGIVIMFQMWQTSDERKRTTASGSDAQISGAIALFTLERDLRMAGYGYGSSQRIGCTVNTYDSVRGAAYAFTLAPILITDGASGAPDTITVFYGNSPTYSATQTYSGSTATSKVANTRIGISPGDLLLIADNNAANGCGMVEITATNNPDNRTIDHGAGSYTNSNNAAVTPRYNTAGGLSNAFSTGELHNLGAAPVLDFYQIRNGKLLTVSNELSYIDTTPADGVNDWTELGDGVIDLQAEYGLDTNGDTIVDTWQVAAPGAWRQVRALRIALLARSQQFEKLAVTNVAPTWTSMNGSATPVQQAFVMRNVDGTADTTPGDANDWRHYRYRVFETIIPLRNMLWGTAP